MKILSIVSGILTTTLLILFFSGVINFNADINEFLIKGNRAYKLNNYEQAIKSYQTGLEKNSEEPRLNYNLGHASYQLNNYDDAIKYYDKANDTLDKYINSGNSSLKFAESIDDPVQKQQLYQQALETYKEGIIDFPQNVLLKYNYEYVKNKLDEQQKQNNEQQDENNEQQDENEEQEKNENQENKNDQQKNQNQQNSNSEQNQQDQNNSENNQDKNSEQKESEEDQQSSQNKENEEKDKESTQQNKPQEEKEGKEQNAAQMEESDASNKEQNDSNIAHILKMLEKQEQESLKNNQEVKGNAKEDEYDW